ncbi:MAG: P13 family porin [Treponema sp.]|nr:P13 family porin [Treponema sp.]
MKRILTLVVVLFFAASVFAQSAADEILKWKQLYDSGAITEAEFQAKKKEILEGKVPASAQAAANQSTAGTASYQSPYAPGSQELYAQIDSLIDDDLEDNKIQIASLAQGLTPIQRDMLFNKYEKSAGLPFVLNFLLGFGIGSFVQGDGGGGAFQCAFEGGGILLVVIGAATITSDSKKNTPSYTCIGLGVGCVTAAAIYGLIRPWGFASNFNNMLRGTLQGNPMAVNFAPIIDPVNNNYGLAAKISL